MELSNRNPLNLKPKMAWLALAGLLPLAAQADVGRPYRDRGARVSGEVQVTHQIPGGTVTVGAEWGRRPQPQVVVVQDRRPDVVVAHDHKPEVVVVERRHGHGHDWKRHHKRDREVTIIREERRPVREKVVVVEKPSCAKPVVVEERGYSRSHEWSDGRQVSVDRQGPNGNYHYYKDGNQVSVDKQGPNGSYHYYEDASQVSIRDNRDGRERNVYVRK